MGGGGESGWGSELTLQEKQQPLCHRAKNKSTKQKQTSSEVSSWTETGSDELPVIGGFHGEVGVHLCFSDTHFSPQRLLSP